MANPHHRAKHKSYVHQKHMMQQHHQHEQAVPEKATQRSILILTIAGSLTGLLICFIANKSSMTLLIIGFIAGATAGYIFGKRIEKEVRKN